MMTLNATDEVADFPTVSQFEPHESAYACVAFSTALCHYAGQPGKGPTGSGEDVDKLADTWYQQLAGSIAASNKQGLTLGDQEQMIVGIGNHFQELPISPSSLHDSDIANVKGALLRGYPVLICGLETGMFDMALGKIPYSWVPSGNHCIVASGIAVDGNLLVRDPANVDGNNVPRPGPRTYDISKLDLISGVVFVPPWMPRPDPSTDFSKPPTPDLSHLSAADKAYLVDAVKLLQNQLSTILAQLSKIN